MDKIIVIIDDTGQALGAVCKQEENFILVDNLGKKIRTICLKMTVKEAKEILLKRKLTFIR